MFEDEFQEAFDGGMKSLICWVSEQMNLDHSQVLELLWRRDLIDRRSWETWKNYYG